MRYWGFLALKVALSCAVVGAFLDQVNKYFWTPHSLIPQIDWNLFFWGGYYTALTGLLFLTLAGLLYLSFLDQRYRCRVCLRRMRMPVEKGSWSRMFMLGRPETEYICIYGHGTLNVADLQISGLENPEWKKQGDIWDELFAGDPDRKR